MTTVPNSALSTSPGNCTDINPEIGITGTPMIDLSSNILYVAAETLENNGTSFVKKLHALDITTGAARAAAPQRCCLCREVYKSDRALEKTGLLRPAW